jgi:hypothetical protein
MSIEKELYQTEFDFAYEMNRNFNKKCEKELAVGFAYSALLASAIIGSFTGISYLLSK